MGGQEHLQEGNQANPGSKGVAGPITASVRHWMCLRNNQGGKTCQCCLLRVQLPPRGTIGHFLLE